jgi:TonB family protein
VVSSQNGTLTIHDGDRVRVNLEVGDVRVRTQASGSVEYRLRVEVPAGSAGNASAAPSFQVSARSTSSGVLISGRAAREHSSERFWVTLELDVPRNTPLEVSTQGGSVDVGDIDGRLVCDTAGGKIRVGRVGASARLETAGGDLSVQDVAGDLAASTGGGNILAGSVRGSATLRTGGGHIRVERIDGETRLETGGGNIFLDRAGARLVATTGGGRIMVGEAAGELQARTGGGGIRVWRLTGPAQIQTGAGSIFLAGVTSPVRASTASGGITALLAPASAPVTPSAPRAPAPQRPSRGSTLAEFECTGGDLVVFLPKDVSLNLDAAIEGGDNFRMEVDPSFALTLKSDQMVSGRAFRAEGVMGGGGPLLRLRAVSGNILLRPADAPEVLSVSSLPAMPVVSVPRPPSNPQSPEDAIEASLAALDASIAQMQSVLELRQEQLEALASAQELQALRMARRSAQRHHPAERGRNDLDAKDSNGIEYTWGGEQLSDLEGLREQFRAWLTDRVIVPAAQMRSRLIRRVDPVYPEKARQMGLEGAVRLRVAVASDGSVEDVKALSGDPLLAEAATDAVKQWRYRPTVLNGKQVPVLTVLTITFHRQ